MPCFPGRPLATVSAAPGSAEDVTTNFDGTTRLWDLATGHQIGSSFTPLRSNWLVASVLRTGGGSRSSSRTARRGRTRSRQACGKRRPAAASRNLTLTEWRQFVGAIPYQKVYPESPAANS